MKTLVVANQKGGVGKTALVTHLAWFCAEQKKKVSIIDLDTQGNASFTLKEFKCSLTSSSLFEKNSVGWVKDGLGTSLDLLTLITADSKLADIEQIEFSTAATNFETNLNSLKAANIDICLIDTAPSIGNGLITSLAIADYVIVPIELEEYSFQGLEKMIDTILGMRRVNPKLKLIGLLPSRVDRRNPRHSAYLKELSEADDLPVLGEIGLRSSIADALASCVPVWKIKKTAARKASQEMRAAASEIFKILTTKNN